MRCHYYYFSKGCWGQKKIRWCVQLFFTVGILRTFHRLMCSVTLQREIPCTVLPKVISSWCSFLGGRYRLVFHVSTHFQMCCSRGQNQGRGGPAAFGSPGSPPCSASRATGSGAGSHQAQGRSPCQLMSVKSTWN